MNQFFNLLIFFFFKKILRATDYMDSMKVDTYFLFANILLYE